MGELAIGIDLGTTNSCVAVYFDRKVKILENSDGSRITPSFVFFTPSAGTGTLVGEHAKRMAGVQPDRGIYEVKRLVGRKFDDFYVQQNSQYFAFKIEADSNNDPLITMEQRDQILKKSPEEVCTIILQKLKKDVEVKLGQTVNRAVITVPAYFNVRQREATLAAAKAAGFTVLKLLNEPTAAALSYYFENDCVNSDYSLVYDLGGGTFDVAILKRSYNDIKIVCVDGDTQLGGHDFDNLIVDYVCGEVKRVYDYNLKVDKNNLRRLHNICEEAKRALSSIDETLITLNGFTPNCLSVHIILTRKTFEKIANELFEKTMKIIDNCVKDSKIPKSSITEVILAGGSTRIPKIQEIIGEYFGNRTIKRFVHPDECVAEGAALQAAMLSKNTKQEIIKMKLTDVIPLSLGANSLANKMRFLIRRNTAIPTSKFVNYVNSYHRETTSTYGIYEGERLDVRKNRFLGEVTLSDLTPAPPGQRKTTLKMNVDENGILTVTAREKYKNNVKELKLDYTRGVQSENEVKNTLWEAEINKEEDKKFEEFVKFKKYLMKYCIAVMYNLERRDFVERYQEIYNLCEETHDNASGMEVEQEDSLNFLIEKVKLQAEPIVKYYDFELMPFWRN